MRRPLILFLATELVAIALYTWQAIGWYGWKLLGPDAFPDSPDAAHLYRMAEKGTNWSEGLVVGLLAGAISLFFAARFDQQARPQSGTALRWAICLLPVASLVIINGAFALQPTR